MTQRVGNPYAPFLDRDGRPLTGALYLGTEDADPETSPIVAYFDKDLSEIAPQPIKVVGGTVRKAGNPALLFVAEETFSMRTRDEDGSEVIYAANAAMEGADFQPLDSDLTAIAALATTAFGRTVLTLANAAALRSHAGIVDSLPLTGGTVSGAILRASAGAHPYIASTSYPASRILITANGAANPNTTTGDIWVELEA